MYPLGLYLVNMMCNKLRTQPQLLYYVVYADQLMISTEECVLVLLSVAIGLHAI